MRDEGKKGGHKMEGSSGKACSYTVVNDPGGK